MQQAYAEWEFSEIRIEPKFSFRVPPSEAAPVITINEGSRSIIALPFDGLRITCTSADDRGIHTQHLTIDIDAETYEAQIAPARTFTIYEDIEGLIEKGLIKGGTLDSAIILKGDKIVSKEPLRFKDELVRHKILDIVGDIVLAGVRLKAHIIAVRPGHALNARLAAAVRKQWQESKAPKAKAAPAGPKVEAPTAPAGWRRARSSRCPSPARHRPPRAWRGRSRPRSPRAHGHGHRRRGRCESAAR